jgi:hypothetical protein
MKKLYLVMARVIKNAPYYVFLVMAKNSEEAFKKAKKITEDDFGFCNGVWVDEVKTLKDIRKILCVNCGR